MKSFNFKGNGLEYFKIWIVNILLTIVTLSLYYPWAKVRNHRYFYANSTLEERNFDYHATGKQLFIGYLISIVLLITYVVIQELFPIGGAIVFLILIAALPWIIWRSLMFNMRVTSFSNVRFSFDGKLGGAYFNYLLMPIILIIALYGAPILLAVTLPGASTGTGVIVTIVAIALLVLALYVYCLIKKRNATYVINGTQYGQGRFSTNLTASEFLKIFLKTVGLFLLAFIAYMVLVAIIAAITGLSANLLELSGSLNDPSALQTALASGGVILLVAAFYIGFIAVSLAVFSYSFTRQRAYIYKNSKLDGKISFASSLGARSMAWVSLTNLLAVIFSLGLATPWAKVRMARLILENTQVDTSLGLDEYVTQKQKEQSALGEQIGDAFDVDVGLGF